eukprot:XP_001690351.1 predicted protein [Chlamydomonas reinhardtii]
MGPQKKKNLLDDEDGTDAPVDFSVRVNKEFAARFEHNERRKELHRLQAKYPEEAEKLARKASRNTELVPAAACSLPDATDAPGLAREAAIAAGQQPAPDSDADSSDDEEEDEGEIPEETEAKIFETMLRIRQKDPAIYQKDVKFFDDEEEGGEEVEEGAGGAKQKKAKKEKPMYLKDMIAKHALEYGPEVSSDDEEEGGRKAGDSRHPKAYDPEQEAMRKAFLAAATLADAYFADENDEDKFLKEYILNKGWVDREEGYVPSYREIAKYNFRYEEPGADRIITHPRNVEGTVRKEDDRRKRQRDAKKARQEAAEAEAREEVKRMKNLKKQEIESKLDKLRNVAGVAAPAATSLDDVLEGDFDPEEWDKKMAAAFNDDYYDDDEGDGKQAGGQKKKRADPAELARQRNELQRLLEDYYKLDYEDNVAGIKTRFRYKPVDPSTFGLSVDDILRLDDKSLNQVVGIKRLAPYREDATKLRPNYKALQMVTADAANAKQKRREYKKRDWEKGRDGRGGGKGGNWWQGKDVRDSGNGAGAGPGSAAANGSGEPERKQSDGEGKGHGQGKGHFKPREWKPKQVDPQQARLASYAVPTLKKDNAGAAGPGGYKRKRDDADGGKHKQQQQQQPKSDGPQLSRAQKKNLKRTQKRAEKKATPGEPKAGEA